MFFSFTNNEVTHQWVLNPQLHTPTHSYGGGSAIWTTAHRLIIFCISWKKTNLWCSYSLFFFLLISDVATPYILHLSFIVPLHIALFSKCIWCKFPNSLWRGEVLLQGSRRNCSSECLWEIKGGSRAACFWKMHEFCNTEKQYHFWATDYLTCSKISSNSGVYPECRPCNLHLQVCWLRNAYD